tara:strand:+ start:73 stop:663 length:591 start_codon:yes stop_codon:yes gene_type:complete
MTQTYSAAVIDAHRYTNVDYDWWDFVYEEFHHICDILGIALDKNEPSFSGFDSQGDGASWTGRYVARSHVATYDTAPVAIREYAPQDEALHSIADELCLLARIYGPVWARVTRHSTHYVHDMTMSVGEWDYLDDVSVDDVDFAILERIEETLEAQFRALACWLYERLEAEYDFHTSDEAVAEALTANEIKETEGTE